MSRIAATTGHTSLFDTTDDLAVEKDDLHVEVFESSRGKRIFSTWARNETSEESNDKSEEMFCAHVENIK